LGLAAVIRHGQFNLLI